MQKWFNNVALGLVGCIVFTISLMAGSVAQAASVATSEKRPVVVELFTSQGCNSCPPAEAFLNKLAKRDNIIALEFHVDYWDYIGWQDPFAHKDFTNRQRAYAGPLQMRYVYTPQMVLNGERHEVGSRVMSVEVAIDQMMSRSASPPAPPLPLVKIKHEANILSVDIQSNGVTVDEEYDILIVSFDGQHETKVTRGENRGKTLINSNIVRDIHNLGIWKGGDKSLSVDIYSLAGNGGCAVLLQKKNGGAILTAAMLSLEPS